MYLWIIQAKQVQVYKQVKTEYETALIDFK